MINIKEKTKDKKLILFGETHGTKETPEMLTRFFSEIAKDEDFNICLEFPIEFQKYIDEFIDSGDSNKLEKMPFFSKEVCSDGRNSLEYFNLIKTIYKVNSYYRKNIKIFCIDPAASNQEEKEKGLADNLLKIINYKKTFAILGGIHASKKVVNIKDIKITPAGYILDKKLGNDLFSVRIAKKSPNRSPEEETFNEGFDYLWELEKLSPATFFEI